MVNTSRQRDLDQNNYTSTAQQLGSHYTRRNFINKKSLMTPMLRVNTPIGRGIYIDIETVIDTQFIVNSRALQVRT